MPSPDMTHWYSRALNIALATRHVLHAGDTAHIDNVQGCSSRYIIIDNINGPISSHVWRIQVEQRCRCGCCRRRRLFKCCFCSDHIAPAQCRRYVYFITSRLTASLSSIDWPAIFLMRSPFRRSYRHRFFSSSSPATAIFIDNPTTSRSTPMATIHHIPGIPLLLRRLFNLHYMYLFTRHVPVAFEVVKLQQCLSVNSRHKSTTLNFYISMSSSIFLSYRFHLFVLVMGPL